MAPGTEWWPTSGCDRLYLQLPEDEEGAGRMIGAEEASTGAGDHTAARILGFLT